MLARFHGGLICGPTFGLAGNDGSVTGGAVSSTVPEVVVVSSTVPPRFVLQPLKMEAAHTIERSNAIFMD